MPAVRDEPRLADRKPGGVDASRQRDGGEALMIGVPGAIIVFAAVFAYVFAFRDYGFDLVDEGTLLAQADRVRVGEIPYLDFHTGYTPGSFRLNAWLFELAGVRVQVVRTALAGLHGLEMATLYWLARRLLPAPAAAGIIALCVTAFRPIASGAFALFNVPYPSWYGQACWSVALIVTLLAARRGRGWWLVGVVWAVTFWFKQNTGLFGLGSALCFAAVCDADEEAGSSLLPGVGLAGALLAGTALVLGQGPTGLWGAVVFGAPVCLLAGAVVRARPGRPACRRAGAMLAGFTAVAGAVVVHAALRAGWAGVLEGVFHVGSAAAVVYGQPHPSLMEFVGQLRASLESVRAARQAFEAVWFLALPAATTLATLTLLRHPAGGSRAWRLLVCTAPLAYLQLHPRSDFWHLATVAGPLLVVLVGLAVRHVARDGRMTTFVAATLWGVALLRAVPTVPVLASVLAKPPEAVVLVERAPIRWDLVTDETLRALPAVTTEIAGASTLVGFPALAGLSFLSGVPSPVEHDYFFPGLLDDAAQRTLLGTLEASPPQYVVVLRTDVAFFDESFRTYGILLDGLERTHPIVSTVGPFEVRRRGES